MRRGVFLLLFVLVSSSFGMYRYSLNCTDGIFQLNGNFFGFGTYYIADNTFVKCENQSLYTYFYGPKGDNTSIFDYFGVGLGTHSRYLFIYLNHTGNFTISNYTFHFNGTHLITKNFSKPAPTLLKVTFTNSTFSLLNTTFKINTSTISTNNFLSFSFDKLSNFTLFNRTPITKTFVWEDNFGAIVLFSYPYNRNPEELFFVVHNGSLKTHNIYDDLSDGVTFYDCNYNISENDVYHPLFRNFSDFIFIDNHPTVGKYFFIFDDNYCINNSLSSTWNTTVDIPNLYDGINYSVMGNGLWFYNWGLSDWEKEVFDLFFGDISGMKSKYKVKIDGMNNFLICKSNVCSNYSFYVNHTFSYNSSLGDYAFMNFSFDYSSKMHVFSKYFNLSFNPQTNITSPNCPWLNITFANGTAMISSTKNQVTCGICIDASYLNKTGKHCKNIQIDEPFINITCNKTLCNYTITSKNVPYIKVYSNNTLLYSNTGSVGSFRGSGNLTIHYGNLAGEKLYHLFINYTQVNQTNNTQPRNSSANQTQSGNNSTNQTNSTQSENNSENQNSGGHQTYWGGTTYTPPSTTPTPAKVINKTNSTKLVAGVKLNKSYTPKQYNLTPVWFNLTGKFIDVNNDPTPYYILPAIPISLAIFLIIKNLPKIERRILE